MALYDNYSQTVGQKRNAAVKAAQGDFIAFVDDDDRVAHNYIDRILEAITWAPGVDVINFEVQVTTESRPRHCFYSLFYKPKDDPEKQEWYGRPAHIMAWSRDIMKVVKFPEKNFEEDVEWVAEACKLADKETQIHEILYYYDFNPDVTETRKKWGSRRL